MKIIGFAIVFWTCLAPIGDQPMAKDVAGDQPVAAQKEMRQKLVSIQVRDPSTQEKPVKGTGFFVSGDGYIVTSTHLFDAFAPGSLNSLKITFSIGESAPNPDKTAYVIESRPSIGVVLLKTPSAAADYPFVTLGTTRGFLPGLTPLILSGFSGGPQTVNTFLSGRDGPAARTWEVQNKVDPGLIGGPVFNPQDGKVVGIIDSVTGSSSAFVPIELANLVLVPFQLSDVNQLPSPAAINKLIDEQTSKFFGQQSGKDLLTAWLRGYLAGAGNSDIEDYIKRNAAKLENLLDTRMKHFVNYSYNDTFQLYTQGGLKQHELPFYKADGDRAVLSCEAKYPASPEGYKNKIHYSFNDGPPRGEFGLSRSGNTVKKYDDIPTDNKSLYDPTRPTNKLDPYQVIIFWIDDEPPINNAWVTVQCTLLIIGTAKYD